MIAILLLIILQSLSSVLCLNCSYVKESNGMGVYVRRDRNGGQSYWIYDRNGSEWQFHLEEKNGQMGIKEFEDEIFSYDRNIINRFSNYVIYKTLGPGSTYNCHVTSFNRSWIECSVDYGDMSSWYFRKERLKLDFENPLIFKTYPMENHKLEAR